MNLLHICSINNNKTSGVSCVVPEHFLNQKKLANVALLNCKNVIIDKLANEKNVFNIYEYGSFGNLPEPFNHPDLVVFHGIYMPKYIKIYKKLLKMNIPYVIIPHGSLTSDAQNIKKLKKKIGNFIAFNKFIKSSTKIQYLSESEKIMSKKFNGDSVVIGNGMNKPNLEKKNFSKDGLKLIYVGRYDIYHKGLDVLLNGCKQAYKFMKDNKITISLYGAGNDGIDAVKNMVKECGVQEIINVNGPIFDKDKVKAILENDFFIQMSRLEGQPLGIMEAMFLGMPIVVSAGTTFDKIVESNDCGYVCSTSEDFVDLLPKILSDKNKFKSLSKNSFNYAKNNFSWNKIANQTITVYKKIINGLGS